MASAVADKPKIKDDEFDIHGDLAVTESEDKSFVVLYDSSKETSTDPAAAESTHTSVAHSSPSEAPTLDDLNESHVMEPESSVHPEDAYIDDILSSDDEDPAPAMLAKPLPVGHDNDSTIEDDDGPISLSSEELDGILEMGPTAEEEFHPDFPVESDAALAAPAEVPAPRVVATPAPDSHFDDEELPIALSDEDLDEILLEEEGSVQTPHHAPTVPMAPVDAIAPPPEDHISTPDAIEDEEPIALSDDELDNILADAEAGHADEAHAAGDHATPAHDGEDEILTLDEEPEITMIDDASPTAEDTAHTSAADAQGFFDSDEDEPITLSDEELDGILSTAPEEDAPKHTDEMALAELPDDGMVDIEDHKIDEDDEPIALSSEELDGILMDAEELPMQETEDGLSAGESGAELAALPPESEADATHADSQGFFDSDEDEPIALSADELDGIAATATIEDAPPPIPEPATGDELADLPPDGEPVAIDDRYAEIDHMDETPAQVADAEDDGPIALSLDELDGIVADSHEVTPEAPMMGLSPHDTGHDEPSIADNTEKPATVFEEDLEAATLIHEDDAPKADAAPPQDTEELKSVMNYLDNLLGELPDDVIEKFAQSEYFKLYQKIMDKLGL